MTAGPPAIGSEISTNMEWLPVKSSLVITKELRDQNNESVNNLITPASSDLERA